MLGPDDVDYAPSQSSPTATFSLRWPFTGFLGLQNPPVFNSAKGGTAVPIKFSLGANRGLGIFASGWPKMGTMDCTTSGTPFGTLTAAQNTGFRFDTANGHYTYDWKTEKGWSGTCRQFVIRLVDGSERILRFRFT